MVKYKLGHWKEVQDLFARAYDIQSTHLEPDHADLAATMSHSAGLLKAMSKLGDAEIVYRTVSLSPADTRVESWPQAVGLLSTAVARAHAVMRAAFLHTIENSRVYVGRGCRHGS